MSPGADSGEDLQGIEGEGLPAKEEGESTKGGVPIRVRERRIPPKERHGQKREGDHQRKSTDKREKEITKGKADRREEKPAKERGADKREKKPTRGRRTDKRNAGPGFCFGHKKLLT